jgi:DNA-binding NarL/FixJ family response regulator
MSESTRIIIVDDHELVANGIAKYFEGHENLTVIGTYTSPKEALKEVEFLKPCILISDLDMPTLNGLELIQQTKRLSPNTKFILLTMHLSKQLYSKAKQMGIDGYLPKSTDEEELFLCVSQLIKGKTYYSQQLMELISSEGLPEKSPESIIKYTQLLSDREREVLILVAEGYSTKEVGETMFLSTKTIETHRKNIMTKLEVHNVAGMVRVAFREGLLD